MLQVSTKESGSTGTGGRGFNIKYSFTYYSFIYSLIHSDTFILLQGCYVWSVWPGSRNIGKYTEGDRKNEQD